MKTATLTTRRGITCQVRVYDQPEQGASSTPILYLHGAGGLLPEEPLLEALSARYEIFAPVWPGYGDEPGEEKLEDMWDFALHGWDVVEAIDAEAQIGGALHLVGHSMGAMIAAEMACMQPDSVQRLALIAPAGLWVPEHPIPDIFALLPFEFPALLFHDAEKGAALMTGGMDFDDPKAIEAFLVVNSRRLGTAGKILFPVPNRRLSKRLYRLKSPTLLVWGESDRLIPCEPYSAAWRAALPDAELVTIPEAGHMVTVEQPTLAAEAIRSFLG